MRGCCRRWESSWRGASRHGHTSPGNGRVGSAPVTHHNMRVNRRNLWQLEMCPKQTRIPSQIYTGNTVDFWLRQCDLDFEILGTSLQDNKYFIINFMALALFLLVLCMKWTIHMDIRTRAVLYVPPKWWGHKNRNEKSPKLFSEAIYSPL